MASTNVNNYTKPRRHVGKHGHPFVFSYEITNSLQKRSINAHMMAAPSPFINYEFSYLCKTKKVMSILKHKHLFIYHKYWDFDGNGILTWEDFNMMAEKYAVYQRRGKYEQDVVDRWIKIVKTWWDSLSSQADTNKDCEVDFDEWLKYFENLSKNTKMFKDLPEFLQNFTQLYFVTLDYNKDGLFDIKDYRTYLANYNMDVTRAEECFTHMLNDADWANGGKMTRERFNFLIYDFFTATDPNSAGKYICGPFDSFTVQELESKIKKK